MIMSFFSLDWMLRHSRSRLDSRLDWIRLRRSRCNLCWLGSENRRLLWNGVFSRLDQRMQSVFNGCSENIRQATLLRALVLCPLGRLLLLVLGKASAASEEYKARVRSSFSLLLMKNASSSRWKRTHSSVPWLFAVAAVSTSASSVSSSIGASNHYL